LTTGSDARHENGANHCHSNGYDALLIIWLKKVLEVSARCSNRDAFVPIHVSGVSFPLACSHSGVVKKEKEKGVSESDCQPLIVLH
jgi:hypothetical protein